MADENKTWWAIRCVRARTRAELGLCRGSDGEVVRLSTREAGRTRLLWCRTHGRKGQVFRLVRIFPTMSLGEKLDAAYEDGYEDGLAIGGHAVGERIAEAVAAREVEIQKYLGQPSVWLYGVRKGMEEAKRGEPPPSDLGPGVRVDAQVGCHPTLVPERNSRGGRYVRP